MLILCIQELNLITNKCIFNLKYMECFEAESVVTIFCFIFCVPSPI